MAALDETTKFPTFQRVRRRLAGTDGLGRKPMLYAVCGVVTIMLLGLVFLGFAWRIHGGQNELGRALSASRLAHRAAVELAVLEALKHGLAGPATSPETDLAAHARAEFQRWLAELVPMVNERRESTERVRTLNQVFLRWIESASTEIHVAPTRGAGPGALRVSPAPARASPRLAMDAVMQACDAAVDALEGRVRLLHWLQLGSTLLLGALGVGCMVAANGARTRFFQTHLRKAQSALAQTHSIITNTQDGVLVLDDQGNIESINPAGERMFAQPATKLLGQPVSILIPQRLFFHDLSGVGRGSFMAMGQRQGYYPFPIEISLSQLKIDGRRQFCALIRDVAERKRGEETLKHIGIGVSAATGDQFVRSLLRQLSKALSFNNSFLIEILGEGDHTVATLTLAEKGELRATASVDLHHTACAEVLAKGFRAITCGAREQFPEDAMLAECEANSFVAMPLADYRGKTIGVMGVMDKDASAETDTIESTLQIFASRAAAEIERKRSEEALAAEKERLAVTLRSIGDGCLTLDNDGKVLMLNPVSERLTGWSQEAAVGKPLPEVLHLLDERTRRRSQHTLQRMAQNGQREDGAAPGILVARDGSERVVESSSAPIRDRAGRKIGVVIVLRDVTERQRLEEERQKAEKLESLGLVAGGIAHDFNNLLTTILGNVTLVLNSGLAPALSDRLKAACGSTHRARDLAGQLLTFAKGGAPVKQATDLGRLVADTVQCALSGSKTACDIHLAEDLWHVEADPGQLAQVIANLTVNADQAMPSGGVMHITAENVELPIASATLGIEAGRWVRFSVKDHGVGIQEQYLKKIFDPYFTTKPKGSGMGLATAYSVVTNHGGHLHVQSAPGEGSTFSVCLPASDLPLQPEEVIPLAVPGGTGRVLILDDEEAICMLVTCALEPLGYEVTETQDGAVALEKYAEAMQQGRKYDLVISDLTMPGRMSGHEAIQRLHALDPEVRAIVSSGYANDPVMSQYQEYGFAGMIAKPYEIDALGRKVAEVLAQPAAPRVIYHRFDQRKTA